MKIISVVGARPNFMKIAPFTREIEAYNSSHPDALIEHILVHTGQHYDDRMSKTFFDDLKIPQADINLNIGSGSHAEQVGYTMIEIEKVIIKEKPDWIVVLGDVNATLACSVAAKKLNVKVCHIEAGLRSGDMQMPEEINRLVTDRISDLLLTPDVLSTKNLEKEGVEDYKIKFVGNIMIDTLLSNVEHAKELKIEDILKTNQIHPTENVLELDQFALITLHRPSNVDNKDVLTNLIDFLCTQVTADMPILWTVHPRTQKQLKEFGLLERLTDNPRIVLLHPLRYHEMLRLNIGSTVVLTDSGGLQEECTVIGTPCLTMRWNTERPITLIENGGVSALVGNEIPSIQAEYKKIINQVKKPVFPELWDGNTAKRCLEAIINY